MFACAEDEFNSGLAISGMLFLSPGEYIFGRWQVSDLAPKIDSWDLRMMASFSYFLWLLLHPAQLRCQSKQTCAQLYESWQVIIQSVGAAKMLKSSLLTGSISRDWRQRVSWDSNWWGHGATFWQFQRWQQINPTKFRSASFVELKSVHFFFTQGVGSSKPPEQARLGSMRMTTRTRRHYVNKHTISPRDLSRLNPDSKLCCTTVALNSKCENHASVMFFFVRLTFEIRHPEKQDWVWTCRICADNPILARKFSEAGPGCLLRSFYFHA